MTWTELMRVIVPGEPVPKARPRFARTHRGVRTYTCKRTVAFERSVALYVGTGLPRPPRASLWAPAGVPVRVDIVAVMKRPQRLQRKKDPPGRVEHAMRPDMDNLIKAILDGIGICPGLWEDDCQVQCIRAEKVYAAKDENPHTLIAIYLPSGYR